MNPRHSVIVLITLVLCSVVSFHSLAQKPKRDRDDRDDRRKERQSTQPNPAKPEDAGDQPRRVDDPDDQEDLNRELWEFARNSPYESILPYVAAAQRRSRATQTAEIELPNGWRLAPAGTQVDVGRLPYEMVEFAGKLVVLNAGYYYQEPQEVSVVDPHTAQLVKTIKLNSLFPSATVALDGDLYISGGFDEKIYRVNSNFEVVREYKVNGFAGGLAPIDRDHVAVAYMATKKANGGFVGGGLALLNSASGQIEHEIKAGYYPYSVRYLAGKLFVTVLGENKVFVFDRTLKLTRGITAGSLPQESWTDGRRLFVVNSNSDDLYEIDTQTERVVSTVSVAEHGQRFGVAPTSCAVDGNRLYVTLGNTNAVAVFDRKSRKRIALIPTGWYPTKVLANSEQLLLLNAKGIQSRRPNPKGPPGAGSSRTGDYVLTLFRGTVSIIPRADLAKNQRRWTDFASQSGPLFDARSGFSLPIKHVFYVIKENRTYDQVLGDLGRGNGDSTLTLFGRSISPIHHQVADEFVTLDNFFCNGEVSVLGHSFTSSGYAGPFLEWMATLTYAYRWNAENNPCAAPGVTCKGGGYPFASVPALGSPEYLWDRLDEKGADYRIYGEDYYLFNRPYRILVDLYGAEAELTKKYYASVVEEAADGGDRGADFHRLMWSFSPQADTREHAYELLGKPAFTSRLSKFLVGDFSLADALKRDVRLRRRFADYLYHYPLNFPSWDLKTSDLERVKQWKKDFDQQLKRGQVAALHYIWLPNDHTDGANKKILDPFQFMAQNDAAVGRLIEIISHSPVWKNSLILIVEDDAQNGPDHVDATRTIAFAAGPYIKRGALVSDRYDQLSMLRTIEIVLGLRPLNSTEQMAAPMFGVFTERADFKPFVAVPPSDRLADPDRKRYEQLAP